MLIPAIAEWHEAHGQVQRELADPITCVAHCLVEAYSVLTRFPEPFRMLPDVAAAAIDGLVRDVLLLDASAVRDLPRRLAQVGVLGGATHDGIIALTAMAHGATIVSLDERAAATYRACGAAFELL